MRRNIVVVLTILAVAGAARGATDGTWIYDGDGDWSDGTKWQDGIVAEGADQTAYFTTDISDTWYVTLDSDRTIGHLQFWDPGGNPRQAWFLQSAGFALTLSTTTGVPTITASTSACMDVPISTNQGFQKLGSEFLAISTGSTYTGVTTVSEGGIGIYSSGALGAAGSGNHTVVADGAYVFVKSQHTVSEDFTITGTGSGYGALSAEENNITIGGDITLDGDAMISHSTSSSHDDPSFTGDISLPGSAMLTLRPGDSGTMNIHIQGVISGTGGLVIEESGAVLYAANQFSGDTVVNGDLDLMHNDAVQNSTVRMNQSSLYFDSTVLAPNLGGLAGSADLDLSQGSQVRVLTVGGNDQDTTYLGSLQGDGSSLTKTCSGTLTLAGDNTYSSGTTVNDGTLIAGHNNALGSGSVNLNGGTLQIASGVTIDNPLVFGPPGGTLGGSGTYLGNLTVGANGIVSPGYSPGLFTINGDYIQQALSSLEIELGGLIRGDEYDALIVTGTMDLAGTLDVTLWNNFEPWAGNSFYILDWGSLKGTFDAVNLPALSAGLSWDTSDLYTSGTLTVCLSMQGSSVVTLAAGNIGQTFATLNGLIQDDGGEACEWRFDWWSSDMSASCGMGDALTTGQSFELVIDGLKPDTLYYCQAYARNSAGETKGNIESFTTLTGCEGTISLLTPNGGEKLVAGSTYEITWQSTGTIQEVLLEYSADNGATWTDVNTVPNTGSYIWEVQDVNNSQQCLVRASGAACPHVIDTSAAVFTIYRCKLAFDLNHDCVVNQLDYDLLMSEWLKCGNPFDPNCP